VVGKILGNRYRLLELIGEGGMALVYKAECSLLCRNVAIKILRPQFASDAEFVERFRREARSAASLSHPNVVSIYDVGQEEGLDYIVMEYVPGRTLKDIIKQEAPLSVERSLNITRQIAEGLNHAHHRSIIHRDIKPHNILVTPDGRIKVTDFGIARAVSAGSLTQAGEVMGSVQYLSPEQAKGGTVGPQSDLYSLGCVLYELLTGMVPFKGDTPISIAFQHLQGDYVPLLKVRPEIPVEVDNIVKKAIAKNLEERYNSAMAFLKDIDLVRGQSRPEKYYEENQVYDETNEPTQVWKRVPKNNGKHEPTEKKRWLYWTVGTIGATLLFLIVLTLYALNVFIPPRPEVIVPNVVGKELTEAGEILKTNQLRIRIVNRIYNPEYPSNTIISQKPIPGQKKKSKAEVEVVVSKGPELVRIPDLLGKTQIEAQLALEEAGLKLGEILTGNNPSATEGTVIKQLPERGAQIQRGSSVTITVNVMTGNLVQVPNFIGRTLTEVRAELSTLGLSFNKAVSAPDDIYPSGTITNQDPAPSFRVPQGTAMTFFVSSGPK
jgi:serine/threonine-protein kinase